MEKSIMSYLGDGIRKSTDEISKITNLGKSEANLILEHLEKEGKVKRGVDVHHCGIPMRVWFVTGAGKLLNSGPGPG